MGFFLRSIDMVFLIKDKEYLIFLGYEISDFFMI